MHERLRDSAQFYIKLDLAILAGLGTVFTILRLDSTAIIDTFWNLKSNIIFIVILLLSGLTLERLVILSKEPIIEGSHAAMVFRILFTVQTAAHILFFMGLLGYVSGYVQASVEFKEQQSTYEFAKNQVTAYLDKYKVLPKSKDVIFQESNFLRDTLIQSLFKRFEYNYVDAQNYEIVLPGLDEILGTKDDWKRPVVVIFQKK